ncbi:Glycerol-3-phosphate dehydrogenase [NAD(+)] [Schistosoma japonicum]|uniref:Glycerol-3-phosphate dehydrogenase [NAD(+)] n=1 Tax=Schistosoma japonicum TaxID=6182 RepID=A0A4Z2CTT3_SCHJA|nr:Glycerol-3-phosphate dehydrogenase [NAD(+)] [Schistosoma japonicum]
MKRVSVLGCGAWGTAISRVIAENVVSSNEFCSEITVYVHNEFHNDRSLVDWINEDHINPVYLPTLTIPSNVFADNDIKKVVSEADIIAVAYPCRYIKWLVNQINGHIKENAYFISFCKTDYLKLVITQDDVGVELCGGIKHIVAIAAGICDGLKLGDNTKSAVLRIGFWEMSELMKELFPDRGTDWLTIEQSCGMAELFMCMSHRTDDIPDIGSDLDLMNITVGHKLSRPGSSFDLQSLTKDPNRTFADGVEYAKQIYRILAARHRTSHFPLFVSVHRICQNELKPQDFLHSFASHPIHL